MLGSLETAMGQAPSPPKVVVSIQPLHSLAAMVMAGRGPPRLLLRGGASPHSYSLRPSDATALSEADLAVWIGPTLERFLIKPMETRVAAARQLQVQSLEGLLLHESRSGGAWSSDAEDTHDHGPGSGHGALDAAHGLDPHLWLDPVNAQAIVAALAERLAALDPSHAALYGKNAKQAMARLKRLDEEVAARLAPVRERPYLVFHDGFQYFERHYGLRALGAVTVSPDRQPGARRVAEIRERLSETGAACIFREPQFRPDLLETISAGRTVRIGVLDPLGSGLEPGPAVYERMMRDLADSIADCLSRT